MKAFATQIVDSDGVFYYGRLKSMIVPATDGEMGLLPDHEEIILALKEGILRYQDTNDKWHKAAIGQGTVQFAHNRCTVVVDTAERPDEIDAFRAEAAAERARERLSQKQSIVDYHITTTSLARAMARLSGRDRYLNK